MSEGEKPKKRAFILEDDPERMRWFREALFETHLIDHVDSCEGISKFKPPYDIIFLDHDLGGRQMEMHPDSGTTFAELLAPHLDHQDVVVIHSYNPEGAKRMMSILIGKSKCDGVIYAPFRGEQFLRVVKAFTEE